MARKTTIAITAEVRDILASLGRKNESFETIINRLIKKWKETNQA